MYDSMMLVNIGESEFEIGGNDLGMLRESNDLLDDFDALRERFSEDGYLLIRGLQRSETVLSARQAFLEHLNELGCVDSTAPFLDGAINTSRGPRGGFSSQSGANLVVDATTEPGTSEPTDDGSSLAYSPRITDMVESPEIIEFFERFLGGEVLPFKHRWLRVAGTGPSTAMHFDFMYMGKGTEKVFTVWCPLGDTPLELGGLALCVGSDQSGELKAAYGKLDAYEDGEQLKGLYERSPKEFAKRYESKWHIADYEVGDVLIFGMYMLHAPLQNRTDRFRLSTDTRYQLASEPVDERWFSDWHLQRTFIGGDA